MRQELTKKYCPQEIEDKIYQNWGRAGYFKPQKTPRGKEKFIAFMAPVNITGSLHMGHALENTLMDVLVRRKRMQGYETLWLPGTDHAGIATQNVIEKDLKKRGLRRQDLGKEAFIKLAWQWKEKYGDIILNQFKKLGVSVDWSRSVFTMDKNYQEAVKLAFLHYYKKGWIYQGKRLINWCPRCETALSDLEVERQEKKGKLWYLKYPLKDAMGEIIVATTRPETMLGDTAVAVHPKDKRYHNLIGKLVSLPLVGRKIPIIADETIDSQFGTGAVKVTPAHSPVDFDIAERHQLPLIQVINEKGKMTQEAGKDFEGLGIVEARTGVLNKLREKNLLIKEEDYRYNVRKCYRCDTPIEPLVSLQWFLKMNKLAGLAAKAVKSGQVKIFPKKWEKPYFRWLENIEDWCISRQIWWGHEIPLDRSEDVLDTWFSSALWPLATLGWPQNCQSFDGGRCNNPQGDLANYYPGDLISSAPEILYLWHVRMIFSGLEFMGKAPFKNIYIHPTVLTKEGQRMSKSLGTGIDPLDLINQYGADATRFGLLWLTGSNQAIRFSEDSVIMGQKFCNKIWNASRFILMNQPPEIDLKEMLKAKDEKKDAEVLTKLKALIKMINLFLEKYRFDKASEALYDFFWHEFCDVYLEAAKKDIFNPQNKYEKERTLTMLIFVLTTCLKLLHPFMPFITEEIYQKLPLKNKKPSLMTEDWPATNF